MSAALRFFRAIEQAQSTREFLLGRGIKCFLRERTPSTVKAGEEAYGFDIFILRDEDVEEARQALDFEFGKDFGA